MICDCHADEGGKRDEADISICNKYLYEWNSETYQHQCRTQH